MIYAFCVVLGAVLLKFASEVQVVISNRLNYGKEVHYDRRLAGHIVTCRFNGSKKYYFVDRYSNIQTDEYFLSKKDAQRACENKFVAERPKSTTFSRVA